MRGKHRAVAPVRFVGRQREDYAGNLFLGAREAGAAVTIVGKDRACMSSRGVWARLLSSAVVSNPGTFDRYVRDQS